VCTTISISRTTKKSSVGSAQSCHGTYVVGPAASIAAARCSRDRASASTDSACPAVPIWLKSSRMEVFSTASTGACNQSTRS